MNNDSMNESVNDDSLMDYSESNADTNDVGGGTNNNTGNGTTNTPHPGSMSMPVEAFTADNSSDARFPDTN